LILDPPHYGIDRCGHELIKFYGVGLPVVALLMVVDSLDGIDAPASRVRGLRAFISSGAAFFDASLKFFHLLLFVAEFIVKVDVLGFLLCKLLLENDDLLFHEGPFLVTHRLLLQLL
jgi:hypothetical protein